MKIESMDASLIKPTVNAGSTNTEYKENKNIPKSESKDKAIHSEKSDNKEEYSLSGQEKKESIIKDKIIAEAIEKANKAILGSNRRLEYSVHEKTKSVMVKVIDTDTKEIIREIPSEKALDMVAKIWEMAGIMVDEKR